VCIGPQSIACDGPRPGDYTSHAQPVLVARSKKTGGSNLVPDFVSDNRRFCIRQSGTFVSGNDYTLFWNISGIVLDYHRDLSWNITKIVFTNQKYIVFTNESDLYSTTNSLYTKYILRIK
jgi:hypothetical protein